MFYDCYSIASVNVSNWNTSNVTSMNGMFCDCYALNELDISSFDCSKVTSSSCFAPSYDGTYMNKIVFGPKFKFAKTNESMPLVASSREASSCIIEDTSFLLQTPAYDGSMYTGSWVKDDPDSHENPISGGDFATKFNADPTTMAGTWYAEKRVVYHVTYDLTNGNTAHGTLSTTTAPVDSTNYKSGDSVITKGIKVLSDDGYKFAGWSLNKDVTDGEKIYAGTYHTEDGGYWDGEGRTLDDKITSNITLYARYDRSKTTVKYDANGIKDGTVPVDDNIYVRADSTTNLTTDKNIVTVLGNTGSLSKAGYKFSGWNTKANGTGTSYKAGDTFTFNTNNDLKTGITLYAQFKGQYILLKDGYSFNEAMNTLAGGLPASKNDITDIIVEEDGATTGTVVSDSTSPVPAYMEYVEGKGMIVIHIPADVVMYANPNSFSMFSGLSSLTSLDVSKFNTDKVTTMQSMFDSCSSLTTLDISSFNTSNVINMKQMFESCTSLTSVNVNGLNTAKVTDMSHMFEFDSSLTSITLSDFSVEAVEDMDSMFSSCKKLTSIDMTHWNTSDLVNADDIFSNCDALEELDLSGFDMSNAKYLDWMFAYDYKLNKITLPKTFKFGTNSTFEECGTKPDDTWSGNWVLISHNNSDDPVIDGDDFAAAFDKDPAGMANTWYAQAKGSLAAYHVTYNENGATDGTVPTDNKLYALGNTVTTLAGSGLIKKDGRKGYKFSGWNTKADGTGTGYIAGTGFTLTGDTVLYAQWELLPIRVGLVPITYVINDNLIEFNYSEDYTNYGNTTTAGCTVDYTNNHGNGCVHYSPTTTVKYRYNDLGICPSQESVYIGYGFTADGDTRLSETDYIYTVNGKDISSSDNEYNYVKVYPILSKEVFVETIAPKIRVNYSLVGDGDLLIDDESLPVTMTYNQSFIQATVSSPSGQYHCTKAVRVEAGQFWGDNVLSADGKTIEFNVNQEKGCYSEMPDNIIDLTWQDIDACLTIEYNVSLTADEVPRVEKSRVETGNIQAAYPRDKEYVGTKLNKEDFTVNAEEKVTYNWGPDENVWTKVLTPSEYTIDPDTIAQKGANVITVTRVSDPTQQAHVNIEGITKSIFPIIPIIPEPTPTPSTEASSEESTEASTETESSEESTEASTETESSEESTVPASIPTPDPVPVPSTPEPAPVEPSVPESSVPETWADVPASTEPVANESVSEEPEETKEPPVKENKTATRPKASKSVVTALIAGAIAVALAATGAFQYFWMFFLMFFFKNKKRKWHGILTKDDNRFVELRVPENSKGKAAQDIINGCKNPEESYEALEGTEDMTILPWNTKAVITYKDCDEDLIIPADEEKVYQALNDIDADDIDVTLYNRAAKIDIPMTFHKV